MSLLGKDISNNWVRDFLPSSLVSESCLGSFPSWDSTPVVNDAALGLNVAALCEPSSSYGCFGGLLDLLSVPSSLHRSLALSYSPYGRSLSVVPGFVWVHAFTS